MSANPKKQGRQILDELVQFLNDPASGAEAVCVWNILTVLRGPDVMDGVGEELKSPTVARVRGAIGIKDWGPNIGGYTIHHGKVNWFTPEVQKAANKYTDAKFHIDHFGCHMMSAINALTRLGYIDANGDPVISHDKP